MTFATELRTRLEQALEHRILGAFTPMQRPFLPERIFTGIASIDALTGGIPLGCLTEICGPPSSGRSSILQQILAEFMRRDETCALVDASDTFDPQSAAAAGVELGRLLWVRCNSSSPQRHGETQKKSVTGHRPSTTGNKPFLAESRKPIADSRLEQALKSTDLLLQAGGFGVVVLDLADIPVAAARRIPLTTWFRFRRAVENTSTAFIVIEQTPHAKSCATLVMDLTARHASWSQASDHDGTVMSAHAGNPAPLFRVTAEGIAIPFEQSATSSFTMPQRWSTPHARLLNTVHVHLQITRSRSAMQPPKLSAKPAFEFENALIHHGDTEAQSSRLSFQTAACGEKLLQTPVA